MRVTTHVEPNPLNRRLTLVIDADGYASLSSRDLDGENAPVTVLWPDYRDLRTGDYTIEARVERADGKILNAVARLQVN